MTETQTAPALRLHSVMLGVRDLDASLAFYADTLGLALSGRFGDFAFLDANGSTLVLSAQLARARPASAAAVEIVLAVESVGDAYRRLLARGVAFMNEPHSIDGTNDVANFTDPDGHLFSIYGSP